MVMKAIGLCALFMVAATLVFVLLFHLKSIKKFVRRFSKKAEPERKVPNRRPQTNVVISKSKVSTKTEEVLDSSMFEEEKSEEVKEETKVEDVKSEEVNEESLTALEEKETETKEE